MYSQKRSSKSRSMERKVHRHLQEIALEEKIQRIIKGPATSVATHECSPSVAAHPANEVDYNAGHLGSSTESEESIMPNSLMETTLQKILKLLIDLQNENQLLRNEMKKLREKVEMKLQVEEEPQVAAAIGGIVTEDFSNLPLTSSTELQNLENLVTKDPSKAIPLARFLCRGGVFNNANALTLLVMKRLLGRSVAMQYSLEGRQEKLRFCDLNLFHVVIASVKMKFEDADPAAISNRIGKVLAGSADWDGNRIRGKRKRVEEIKCENDV